MPVFADHQFVIPIVEKPDVDIITADIIGV